VLGLVAESAAFLAPSVGLQSRTALPLSSLRNAPRAEARSSVISLQSTAEDAVSSAGRRQLIIGAGLALMGIPQASLADESYLEELAGSDGMCPFLGSPSALNKHLTILTSSGEEEEEEEEGSPHICGPFSGLQYAETRGGVGSSRWPQPFVPAKCKFINCRRHGCGSLFPGSQEVGS
jgi:hypothetical protein